MATLRLKKLECRKTAGGPIKLKCDGTKVWEVQSMNVGEVKNVGVNRAIQGSTTTQLFDSGADPTLPIPTDLLCALPESQTTHPYDNLNNAKYILTYDVV